MILKKVQTYLTKEDGTSLPSVLIVIIIISTLVGTILLSFATQHRFIQRDIDALKARYAAEGAIYQFLSDATVDSLGTKEILLPDSSMALLKAEQFGGFFKLTSEAAIGGQTKKVQVLAGGNADSVFSHAVTLGDINSALNLAGKVKITGNIKVGRLGVKKSSFKGELFSGSVKGKVQRSDSSTLASFDNDLIRDVTNRLQKNTKNPPPTSRVLRPGRYRAAEIQQMVTSDSSTVFYAEGDLEIFSLKETQWDSPMQIFVSGDLTLQGNIGYHKFTQIAAGDSLSISGEITGSHGLFFGNRVTIRERFNGSGQFLAKKGMMIKGESYLKYPSLVYLGTNSNENVRKGSIELVGPVKIDGTVIIPPREKGITEDQSKLIIGKKATIRGGIYNGAKTELHGTVLGSVSTFQFYFYHSPTAYINWLKDTQIDITKRPDNYTIPLGFENAYTYRVLDWQELQKGRPL